MLKREGIKAPPTKFRWDRGIVWYWIVAVLDPNKTPGKFSEVSVEQKNAHSANVKQGWRGSIFELKSPIMMDLSFSRAIVTDNYVIYTPFKLNKKESISHLFEEVEIPVLPDVSPSRKQKIPDYAILGATSENKKSSTSGAFYGVRIDTAEGIDSTLVLEMFLRLVRQETKQWWVTSSRNPFDYGYRMSFELKKNLGPRDVLMDPSLAAIETPWAANIATQNLVGFEENLNLQSWVNIAKHLEQGSNAEAAISFFFDAITAFMSYDDSQTIMFLALFFEVAENKIRLLNDEKYESKNKNILANPRVATSDQIDTFRKLITDRDNIAHGKGSYHQKKNPALLVIYLDTAAVFFGLYLEQCKKFDWKTVSELEL